MSSRTSFAVVSVLSLVASAGLAPAAMAQSGTFQVSVVVFYDQNRNGVLDPGENVRLPNVMVAAAGQTARTSAGGVATLQVPGGAQPVAIAAESLPAYYQAGASASLQVPQQSQLLLPVTLPIGAEARPNTYMAFGDSITAGEGSSDGDGYREVLESRLIGYLGAAQVLDEGVSATRSQAGAQRIADSLRRRHPAYTLIHYGTNDWNEQSCRSAFPCYTIDSLRTMVREAKAQGSLPVLATIIPSNTDYNAFVPQARNDWLALMNALIRELASQEGAVLADQWAAFFQVKEIGQLFVDHVHPNDAGYKIMANTFFDAITRPRQQTPATPAALARVPGFGLLRPEQAAALIAWPREVPADPWDAPAVRR